jgi:hypothetical protein
VSRSAIGCVGTPTQRGQTIDERDDRLECGAPWADDDRGAKGRHGHGSGLEPPAGLDPAAEVRRELGFAVAEAAEVDQLPDSGALRLGRERAGSAKVAILEVGASERMNQVVGDLDAIEGSAHRIGIDRIGLAPFDAVGVVACAARDPDHLVALGEHRQERCADRPGGAEDCDSHSTPSLARRAK